MRSLNPIGCIFAGLARPSRHCLRRNLHTSQRSRARPPPKHQSVRAEDMGLVQPKSRQVQNQAEATEKKYGVQPFEPQELAHPRTLKPYTEEEMATLQKVYTPEQIASIEAGEAAVDPEDLKNQAVMREDSMRLDYFDDLKNIHPVVDKPVRAPEENYDPNLRFKTQDEFVEEWARWFEQQGDAPDATEFAKFQQNQRLTVGKEEAERDPRSYKAPTLPVIPSLAKGIEKSQTDPARQRLMQQTGFSDSEIRRLRTKILVRHRVVNQTSMGKKQRNYALCVAGNGKGLLGIGEGKSTEILDAMKMATFAAIRTMVPIPRYEERTIYGDVHGKVAGTVVELMHRTPGRHGCLWD